MIRWHKKDLIIALYVKPNAKTDKIVGLFQHYIKIQIAAPAIENKANLYLSKWLAKQFHLPNSHIILEQGQQSRYKIFRIVAPQNIPSLFQPFLIIDV